MQKTYADILRQVLSRLKRYPSKHADILHHALEFYHEHCNMSDQDFIFLTSIVDTAIAPFIETYRAGFKNGEQTGKEQALRELREMLGEDMIPEDWSSKTVDEVDYEEEREDGETEEVL